LDFQSSGRAAQIGRASNRPDEIAPTHSITTSARASKVDDTMSPSDLAVLRVITNATKYELVINLKAAKSLGIAMKVRPTFSTQVNVAARSPANRSALAEVEPRKPTAGAVHISQV